MKKTNRPEQPIDVSQLRIVDEPYTDGRSMQATKYDAFFATVQPNKRIQCPRGKAGGLANSLRKWLKKRGHKEPNVRARERCDDDLGGVWWVKEAPAPQSPWAGLQKRAGKGRAA